MSESKDIGTILLAIVGTIALIPLIGFITAIPVYYLWNWLCPIVFHLPKITYWQAWGIQTLSSFLIYRGSK